MIRFQFALGLVAAAGTAWSQPTYSRDVSRIIQEKCQMCHRPGDIAPFAFMTYDDVRVESRRIKTAVLNGQMPPWKPIPGHGSFKGDLSLTGEQVQTITDWIDAGMTEGDPGDMSHTVIYADQWRLGPPDQGVLMAAGVFPVGQYGRP